MFRTDQQVDRFLEHMDSISVSLHSLAKSHEALAVARVRKMNREEPLVPLATEDHFHGYKNLKAAATRFVDWIDTFEDAHAMQETGAYKYLRAALKFPVPEGTLKEISGHATKIVHGETVLHEGPDPVAIQGIGIFERRESRPSRLIKDLEEQNSDLQKEHKRYRTKMLNALETAEQFRGERDELRVD